MKLAIVSDEIDRDFETAVRLGVEMGIFRYEVRMIGDRRVPLLSDEQLKQIKKVREEYQIEITAVSPGLFKVPLRCEQMKIHRTELFERTVDFAQELGVRRIIIFGVLRSKEDRAEDYNEVIDIIREASVKAKDRGFVVNLENEPGSWADTSENIHRLLKDLRDTGIKLNWDVGNLFNAGEEDYRYGYQLLRHYIDNVHVKDVKKISSGNIFVPVGQGDIDWKEQLEDLKNDGYTGNVVIETHCKPLYEASRESVRYVKEVAGL